MRIVVLTAALITALLTSFAGASAASPAPGTTSGAGKFGMAMGCCFQALSSSEQNRQLGDLQALNVYWVRLDVNWESVQSGGATAWNWSDYDRTVANIRAHNMQVLGMLAYAPAWARLSVCRQEQMCPPAQAADYARFAEAAARRYPPGPGVAAWELWNEPNLAQFWLPTANAAQYSQLVVAAGPAIHRASPSAVVVSGGLSPAASGGDDVAPVDFLAGMYASGVAGTFDAVGHHPYCYSGTAVCPSTGPTGDAWSQMAATSPSLRSVMIAHGDGAKQIWATEFGAPTGGPRAVSPATQAAMIQAAYLQFSRSSWAGPLFVYTYRDPGTNPADGESWFGLVSHSYVPKLAFNVYKVASSIFQSPGSATALAAHQKSTVSPASVTAQAAKPLPTTSPLPTLSAQSTSKPRLGKTPALRNSGSTVQSFHKTQAQMYPTTWLHARFAPMLQLWWLLLPLSFLTL